MEGQVAIPPVESPGPLGLPVLEAGDKEAAPAEATPRRVPGRAALEDRDLRRRGIHLDPNLLQQLRRDPLARPPQHSVNVEIGDHAPEKLARLMPPNAGRRTPPAGCDERAGT